MTYKIKHSPKYLLKEDCAIALKSQSEKWLNSTCGETVKRLACKSLQYSGIMELWTHTNYGKLTFQNILNETKKIIGSSKYKSS